jgi:PilZ domain
MRQFPTNSSATTAPTTPPAMDERRARVRFRCARPTRGRAFIAASFQSMPARVLDLSVAGVGLLVAEPLPLGTRLNVEVEGAAATPFELLAEVTNVTAHAAGGWRCGCDLVWKISDDELRLLLK